MKHLVPAFIKSLPSSCHYSISPFDIVFMIPGLLGTNNNEVFDEMKLPNNKITSSVTEFMNSWLVTQSSECMIKEESNEAPTCNKAPSDKCFEVLKSSESPLSPMFQNVDPLPFLKACLVDTADCESQESATTSHCAATKAYMIALSQQGYRPENVKDCGECYTAVVRVSLIISDYRILI